MKRILVILAALVLAASTVCAKDKDEKIPNYTIEGKGAQGAGKLVTVTIITKKPNNISFDELKKAAIHGVLFRGYTSANGMLGGATHNPSIMGSPLAETQHSEFFSSFFKDGMYNAYVQEVQGSRRVVKSGKEHKVSCNLFIQDNVLRNDLTKAGLIKALGSGL